MLLEEIDRPDQALHRGLGEKYARRTFRLETTYALGDAAPAVGDHRRAACLRLHRNNPEILLSREEKCTGALHIVTHDIRILIAENANILCRHALYPAQFWAIPDHNEALVAEMPKRCDYKVDPLVRNQSRRREEEIVLFLAHPEILHIDGRIKNGCIASIHLPDAPTDKG